MSVSNSWSSVSNRKRSRGRSGSRSILLTNTFKRLRKSSRLKTVARRRRSIATSCPKGFGADRLLRPNFPYRLTMGIALGMAIGIAFPNRFGSDTIRLGYPALTI